LPEVFKNWDSFYCEDKCCYCIHDGKDDSERIENGCPTVIRKECLFQPNNNGVKLIDVLHSKLFQNWLKRFRKELDEIDKKSKVFLCGGLLKRGFTLGDIDILIVSPQTNAEAFSELESHWIGNSLSNKKLQYEHNAQKVSELMLDVWIYDRTFFRRSSESFEEITPKSLLISDLRKGLVRMRIA
jgi:predicted nucleotidyltransferase